jgi:hypothetical protein
MIGKGLRSGVHGCLGFFSREGVKNLPAMKGKGLRGHFHCEYPKIRKALSFPLISPVARPGCFSQRAHPQPVLSHQHRGRPIPLIKHLITESKTSKALRPAGFRLVRAVEAVADG